MIFSHYTDIPFILKESHICLVKFIIIIYVDMKILSHNYHNKMKNEYREYEKDFIFQSHKTNQTDHMDHSLV